MIALYYLLVFGASFFVDCIPVFAPPAWTLMLLIMLKFKLNPWLVVTVGTCGTTLGRSVFLSFIVPWFGAKALGQQRNEDLKFLGRKLSGRGWAVTAFVFIYSLLPLSTTALFTAAGLAKVKKRYILPPFFLGNFIGDAILLLSGKYAFHNLSDIFKGSTEPKSLIIMAAGILIVGIVLVIDWRTLLIKKQLRIKWKFWK
jgi:membrane protein YqaA with SNARE-associated domain